MASPPLRTSRTPGRGDCKRRTGRSASAGREQRPAVPARRPRRAARRLRAAPGGRRSPGARRDGGRCRNGCAHRDVLARRPGRRRGSSARRRCRRSGCRASCSGTGSGAAGGAAPRVGSGGAACESAPIEPRRPWWRRVAKGLRERDHLAHLVGEAPRQLARVDAAEAPADQADTPAVARAQRVRAASLMPAIASASAPRCARVATRGRDSRGRAGTSGARGSRCRRRASPA